MAKSLPSIARWVDDYTVEDYPYGRERSTARWYVERKGGKARVCRVTVNPKNGRPNKPKCTTYSAAAKIGVESNGHAICVIGAPGHISVYNGAFQNEGSFFPKDADYEKLAKVLGFESGPRKVEVKKHSNGAVISGLAGQVTKLREILEIGGLSQAEIERVKQVKRKNRITHEEFLVEFVDGRKPYKIEIQS